MFDKIGQLAGIMKALPKIREEMEQLQQRLAQVSVEGDAGGGMVKVRVNGRLEMLSCSISDETLSSGDKELIEELIRAATNQALIKARQQAAEETTRLASALGVPAGVNLPGLGTTQ